ncbi:hypothetical protein [Silvanigrella sp.]|jgi:glutathione synthase|uniref:hypothetical protein n=1 Tax=Silvanigrella sp. TaxID=2024976 RepID=UPI0037CBCA61
MQKKLLIIADPIDKVRLKSDSSLALAQAAIEDSWQVLWCESNNVHVFGENVFVSNLNQIHTVSTDEINFNLINKKKIPIKEFEICFVRKDPPFNENYKDLCWILASQSDVKIINPAEALLSFHEKALQWKAFSDGVLTHEQIIPTCLSSSFEIIEDFCNENKSLMKNGIICKPWLGHGGESVEYFKTTESLLLNLKNNENLNMSKIMIQPFLEEIHTQGDRRVLIANGVVIGDFVRIPAEGKIASNLAQGGSAILREMTKEQKLICNKIAEYLKSQNILFAGLDLIGCRIGEINITSPTGLRIYEFLTGKNIAKTAFQLMVK